MLFQEINKKYLNSLDKNKHLKEKKFSQRNHIKPRRDKREGSAERI